MKKLFVLFVLATSLCTAHADTTLEGFESGNLDAYTAYTANTGVGQSTASVGTAYAHDGSYGLGLNGGNWYLRSNPGVTLSQGSTFSTWIKFSDLASRAYLGFGSSATGTYAAVLGPNTNSMLLQHDAPLTNSTFTDLSTVDQTFTTNTWYNLQVSWAVGGLITENLYGSDGVTLLNTTSATDNSITTGSIAFRAFGDSVTAIDSVVVASAPTSTVPDGGTTLVLLGSGLIGLGLLRKLMESTMVTAPVR